MQEYKRSVETTKRFDVVVAGGGPAGIAAAIAAARQGLSTLLLESNGCAGGTSVAGALPFWLGYFNGSIAFPWMIRQNLSYSELPRPRRVVGGIFQEAMDRITEQNGGDGPCKLSQTDRYPGLDRLGCHDEFTFDIEIGKRVLDEMLVAAGVEVLYYTSAIDVERQGNVVEGVYFVNKSGLQYAPAKVVIDCTGDADMVYKAGFGTYKGDRATGEMTAASLVAHLENIDSGEIEHYLKEGNDPWFRPLCEKAIHENPGLDLPKALIIFPMVQDGVFMVNGGTSFGGYDGTCGVDRTALTLRGRQRARLLSELLFRHYIPGGKNNRVRLTAYYPGIRETRRIEAEYILTEDDLLNGTHFEDTIALAGRHFDLGRAGGQVFADKGMSVKNGITAIPYRSLIPRGADNILAGGRCIAADGQALGPARIISTCFAVGQAAGTAAAVKLKQERAFFDIDVSLLQRTLVDNDAEVFI